MSTPSAHDIFLWYCEAYNDAAYFEFRRWDSPSLPNWREANDPTSAINFTHDVIAAAAKSRLAEAEADCRVPLDMNVTVADDVAAFCVAHPTCVMALDTALGMPVLVCPDRETASLAKLSL